MLRNRDLNVQQQNEADQQKQQRKYADAVSSTAGVKRQAAHLVTNKEEPKDEPKPKDEPIAKRTCTAGVASSTISPEFSKALILDSTKRTSIGCSSNKENISFQLEEEQCHLEQFELDQEQVKDLSAMSEYVLDIFNYYKSRERFFRVGDYSKKHHQVNFKVRAELVDWLIDIQETFELNHETLYLGVKLFDMFMDRVKKTVQHKELKLIASAAMFVAAKFDERLPPLIDDFIYMSEDSFTREQMMMMERELLKTVHFDLGCPLSYRFLRRYARVTKSDMGTLTLARYALEMSLMSLDFCRKSESLIAAASLLLAKRMKGTADEWSLGIVQRSSGYSLVELEPLMWDLNKMLVHRESQFGNLENVFRKYSHENFFKVAKIKTLQEPHRKAHRGGSRHSGKRPSSSLK